jgi:hypothetical protein
MPEEASFRVSWSQRAIDTLKQRGGDKELARLVRTLDERLRRDPVHVGEVYRSRGAIEEHLAVQESLAIDFAVDTQRRFVLVRGCHILTGSAG